MDKTVARVTVCLAISLALLTIVACGQGRSAGPAGGQAVSPGVPGFGALASVPRPGFLEKTAVFTSNLFLGFGARITPGAQPNTRIVYRHIHVWYTPCEPLPMGAVAPIILRDLYSGSEIYLDREGLVRPSPKPAWRTKMGRARLEAVLGNRSLMKDVLAASECEREVSESRLRRLSGWPDPHLADIGEPAIPRVALSKGSSVGSDPVHPGWRGAYCWPMDGGQRTCEDVVEWTGLAQAEPLRATSFRGRLFVHVLGDDSEPGGVIRIQLFEVLEEEPVLRLGEAIDSIQAEEGETLVNYDPPPGISPGFYVIVTGYESQLGEVSHGFKVSYGGVGQ